MSQTENLWGGFQSDEDESLKMQAYDGAIFGLNEKAKVTRFEYSTSTGAGGAEGNPAIIIEFEIGSTKNLNTRIWSPIGGKVYFKGSEQTNPNSEDYKNGVKENIKKTKSLVTHYLKAFGKNEADIATALSAATSFEDMGNIATALAKDSINTKEVDIFLQFQANIRGTSEKTYLELPGSLVYGSFITAAIAPVGKWTQVDKFPGDKDDMVEGLAYIDDEGNYHRFTRDKAFMDSKVSKIQTKADLATGMLGAPSTPGASAATTNWGS